MRMKYENIRIVELWWDSMKHVFHAIIFLDSHVFMSCSVARTFASARYGSPALKPICVVLCAREFGDENESCLCPSPGVGGGYHPMMDDRDVPPKWVGLHHMSP